MIYRYKCDTCQTVYDIYQGIREKHEFECPTCKRLCKREWHAPQISVSNGGFYSATVGEYVKDYKDFDRKLDRTRYMTRMAKHLRRQNGYNRSPEQEWVDTRESKEAASRKRADRDWEESQAWLEKANKTAS